MNTELKTFEPKEVMELRERISKPITLVLSEQDLVLLNNALWIASDHPEKNCPQNKCEELQHTISERIQSASEDISSSVDACNKREIKPMKNAEPKGLKPEEAKELRSRIGDLESSMLMLRGMNEILFRLTERRPAASDSSIEARDSEMLFAIQNVLDAITKDVEATIDSCIKMLY